MRKALCGIALVTAVYYIGWIKLLYVLMPFLFIWYMPATLDVPFIVIAGIFSSILLATGTYYAYTNLVLFEAVTDVITATCFFYIITGTYLRRIRYGKERD